MRDEHLFLFLNHVMEVQSYFECTFFPLNSYLVASLLITMFYPNNSPEMVFLVFLKTNPVTQNASPPLNVI